MIFFMNFIHIRGSDQSKSKVFRKKSRPSRIILTNRKLYRFAGFQLSGSLSPVCIDGGWPRVGLLDELAEGVEVEIDPLHDVGGLESGLAEAAHDGGGTAKIIRLDYNLW